MFDIYFKGTANEILHYLKCKHSNSKFIVEFEQGNNIPQDPFEAFWSGKKW